MDFSRFRGKHAAQCWYSAGDYKEIKAGMKDGDKLPALYADWLAGAEQREQQLRAHGAMPVRVLFDMAEFRRFCEHFGVALDSKARSNFAALKSQADRERDTGAGGGGAVH